MFLYIVYQMVWEYLPLKIRQAVSYGAVIEFAAEAIVMARIIIEVGE